MTTVLAELALAGFVLARIGDAHKLLTSFGTRIRKYRKGHGAFKNLSHSVGSLTKQIAEVENILGSLSTAPETSVAVVFNETFANVCNTLEEANSTIDKSFSVAFSARGCGAKMISCFCQFSRANTLSEEMSALQSNIDISSNKLLHLIGILNVNQGLSNLSSEIGNINVFKEEYSPRTSTPSLDETIKLDFDAEDELENPTTPEGRLKHSVLFSSSSGTVTAAAGVMKRAVVALGMPGVGKTVALQGLGHDKDILERFCDGVHYMKFGRGATLETAIREIAKIMKMTGLSALVNSVKGATSLKEAVDYAVSWFEGKTCLYLLDDVWPEERLPRGYLLDLRELMRGSPDSRMAISTRSRAIASDAGCIVDFGPRLPLGPVSVRMFMAHATKDSRESPTQASSSARHASVRKILEKCGGLPIALAVTGCAVAFLLRRRGSFEKACDEYAKKLEKKQALPWDEDTAEGTSLNARIMLSLEFLHEDFQKWKVRNSLDYEHTISELYTSLCVLESQSFVPLSVLSRLWQLEEDFASDVMYLFCDMSLARLHNARGSSKETGMFLHDLQLGFCKREAEEKKMSTFWHDQLLNGYLVASHQSKEGPRAQLSQEILAFEPREWWSTAVEEDGYIHSNISSHLSCAERGIELAALLLDARWTELRVRIGGILAITADFEVVDHFFEHLDSPGDEECSVDEQQRSRGRLATGLRAFQLRVCGCLESRTQSNDSAEHYEAAIDVQGSFRQIFKSVRLSWGRHVEGAQSFQFQVCGHLVRMRNSNAVVDKYLKSVEAITSKPYLVPVSPPFPGISTAQIMQIPIGGECSCVACSPCGQYIAAGAGRDVVIAASSTGEILTRMQYRTRTTCIAFFAESKQVVSGSTAGEVMVRAWESPDSPVHKLEGHRNQITAVAVSANDRSFTSTSLDGTVVTWDTTTGAEMWKLGERSGVNCISISAEDGKIALGLGDGTLKVLNGARETILEDTKAHSRGITCVSFSPNGSDLATGSYDFTVRLWNTQTWTCIWFGGHAHKVTGVAFSPNSNQIASSSIDRTVRLWDVGYGHCVGVTPSIDSAMRSVSFTANGERIVTGSDDGIVRIWDARLDNESNEQRYGHNGPVYGVAISEDGLQIASASFDQTVRLWDSKTGDQVGIPLEGHYEPVHCVSFSPDGRLVVSGSRDKTLRLWNTKTHLPIGNPFEGHTSRVSCVSFSSDGRRIISGSYDKSVRIWNAITHEQIGNILQGHERSIERVSESADGLNIVSRDWYRRTIIWARDSRTMIWTSDNVGKDISDADAERIIRSCDPHTPHLWPNCFSEYTGELFCEGDYVYLNSPGEKTCIGNIPSANCWTYHQERKIVVIGLQSGASTICKLVTECKKRCK